MFAFATTIFYALCFIFALGPLAATASPLPQFDLSSIVNRGSPRQISAFLDSHNIIRASHNATALQWSDSLAEKAALWADQCQFKHTNGVLSDELYGENIVAGTVPFSIPAAVATFIADEDKYDPANPSYLLFTQVVWKSTTELGCAVSQCNDIFNDSPLPANLYVCLYNPVGNVIGQAPENVQV